MSRIDEALRRAALNRPAAEHPVTTPEFPAPDVADFAREAYPVEMPQRRPVLREAASPVTAQVLPTRAPTPAPVTAPVPEQPRILRITHHSVAEKLVTDARIQPTSREQYRRLAGTLHHAQDSHGLKVVMVASAVPGEGKTLTAANLALTFSDSYHRRVLLVDADLRRPTLHTIFGVDNSSGLSDLTATEHRHLAVKSLSPRLALLPAGPVTADPMAGLTSDRMRRAIEEARESFDWVILDTPPLVMLPDASLLGAMADGAVLVIRAGATPFDLVSRAVATLGRERILGVVLNGAESSQAAYGYAYDYAPLPQVNTETT